MTNTGDIARKETDNLISAGTVKGTAVYDVDGDKIGSIDEVMLDKVEGKVAYAVMSFGGFLGIGEKYHPLPWDSLTYDQDHGGYRVGMKGEMFRDAPSYDREELSTFGNRRDDVDGWYGRARSEGRYAQSPGKAGFSSGAVPERGMTGNATH
jgi:sporulation protein YlmC with PRC-barrel domain